MTRKEALLLATDLAAVGLPDEATMLAYFTERHPEVGNPRGYLRSCVRRDEVANLTADVADWLTIETRTAEAEAKARRTQCAREFSSLMDLPEYRLRLRHELGWAADESQVYEDLRARGVSAETFTTDLLAMPEGADCPNALEWLRARLDRSNDQRSNR